MKADIRHAGKEAQCPACHATVFVPTAEKSKPQNPDPPAHDTPACEAQPETRYPEAHDAGEQKVESENSTRHDSHSDHSDTGSKWASAETGYLHNCEHLMSVGGAYLGLSILCAIASVIGGIVVWADSEGKMWPLGLAMIVGGVFLGLTGAFVDSFCTWLAGVRSDIRMARNDTSRLVELAEASAKADAKGANMRNEQERVSD